MLFGRVENTQINGVRSTTSPNGYRSLKRERNFDKYTNYISTTINLF